MPIIKPGNFCWIELATTHQEASKQFYHALFGWDAEDHPMGPTGVYTMFKLGGRDAAAAYKLRDDQVQAHIPPHWMLYVAVDSADAAAAKAAQLGGTVLMPPFDVMDAGRMAALRDPTGAVFSVWQAKRHPGLGAYAEVGALCWADLVLSDRQRAKEFYEALFGWKLVAEEYNPSGYTHIKNGDDFIGGVPPVRERPPGVPPHWLGYFQVADCNSSAANAESLGARLITAPMEIQGTGRFAVIADPQGAVFAIFQSMRQQH